MTRTNSSYLNCVMCGAIKGICLCCTCTHLESKWCYFVMSNRKCPLHFPHFEIVSSGTMQSRAYWGSLDNWEDK